MYALPLASQDGLRGNRAVAATPLAVVAVVSRAYPLLLGSYWEAAVAAAGGASNAEPCFAAWAQQVRWAAGTNHQQRSDCILSTRH